MKHTFGYKSTSGSAAVPPVFAGSGTVGPEVNDVLVDMVDAMDELDTHIVKGPGRRNIGTRVWAHPEFVVWNI